MARVKVDERNQSFRRETSTPYTPKADASAEAVPIKRQVPFCIGLLGARESLLMSSLRTKVSISPSRTNSMQLKTFAGVVERPRLSLTELGLYKRRWAWALFVGFIVLGLLCQ
ncbi:MAG: hypothetical protein ABI885_11265 [Gammaproteobacteria bacterium]